MESSTSAHARPAAEAPQYTTRDEVRRAIRGIVLGTLLRRIVARGGPTSLTKAQRRRARQHADALEDILYRFASCFERYRDPSTLEERVRKAWQSVSAIMDRPGEADEAD